MSIRAPEGTLGQHALNRSQFPFVDVGSEPVLDTTVKRASEPIRSGLHAILPGPPDSDGEIETLGAAAMQLDFDDQTDPFIGLRLAELQQTAANTVRDAVEDELDEKTVVAPKPKFDPEETLDEFPDGGVLGDADEVAVDEELGDADEVVVDIEEELGEEDEVAPATERRKPTEVDEVHTKETWPKMPVAPPSDPATVDEEAAAFGEALVAALTTDPDGDFEVVRDEEIIVVK
jgi:hypothetical protein